MALALKDRVKETTIVVGTGAATLLGSSIGFQPFSVVGNGNTTYYCISDQFGSNWEVGIGTYSSSGNTLARTTVLASSNGGALVVFTTGVKDVFVTYPAEKGVWLDASNNAIGLGTPAAFVGTNITGTASGLTAGNVTTNANLSGAVSSIGNSTSLGSFTSAQLALAISDETGTGKAVFATNPTLTSPTYAGTLTGSTDILNIGSGQIYKDASGNVGIGTNIPAYRLDIQGNAAGQFWASIKNTNAGASSIGGWLFGNDTYSDVGGVFAGSSGGGGFGGANSMNIGSWKSAPLAMFTNNTERMRIDSSGNVGIGTSSPSQRLHVSSSASGSQLQLTYPSIRNYTIGATSDYALAFRDADANAERMRIDSSGGLILAGSTAQKATGTTWSNPSDIRIKDNITEYAKGLNELMQVSVKEWDYNGKGGTVEGMKGLGVIADEVVLILPNTVDTYKAKLNADDEEDSDIKKFDATEITWLMLKSIQELKAIIDTQQEQINFLLEK